MLEELINQIATLIYNYSNNIELEEYNEIYDRVWDIYQDIKFTGSL